MKNVFVSFKMFYYVDDSSYFLFKTCGKLEKGLGFFAYENLFISDNILRLHYYDKEIHFT